jgi:chemotaxis protein MotB
MGLKKCSNCGANVKYPDGAPTWCLSYGDMVTNLMAFFVALLSFATFDAAKFEAALKSLQVTFGVGFLEGGESINLTETRLLNAGDQNRPLGKQEDPLINAAPQMMGWQQENMGQAISSETIEDGYRIRIADDFLFDKGSSLIRPEAAPMLANLGTFLEQIAAGRTVRFEGHSDDVTFFDALSKRDNLTLSTDRAIAVYRAVGKTGVLSSRMSVAGFGNAKPVPRLDGEAEEVWRSRNRRVDVIVSWADTDTGARRR